MMRRQRCCLAVLASHPIQYFAPIYKRLAATPGLDVEVLYCREFGTRPSFDKQFAREISWDASILNGYNYRFLWNLSPVRDTFNPLHAINPGAFTRLLRGFDALWVNGYLYPSNWLAAAAATIRGTRILLRSELRLHARSPRWYDAARSAVLQRWISRADALLYIGAANREAYSSFGVPDERLFFCPYAGDTDRIRAAAIVDADARAAALDRWGLPRDRCIILFVGKLTARKHPEVMLDIAATKALENVAHVALAGSGPMSLELSAAIATRELKNVSLLGFVNQSELPQLYNLADVFVMPSSNEPWGVVLHEAMSAGIAAVASTDVGAARDLITHGETGFAFPVTDPSSIVECVVQLVKDPSLRARIARAGRVRSSIFSYDAAAAGVLDALSALRVYDRVAKRWASAHDESRRETPAAF